MTATLEKVFAEAAKLPTTEQDEIGLLWLEDLQKLPRERWHLTRLREMMRPVAPEMFVQATATLQQAREQARGNGLEALAVVDGAGLVVGFLQARQLK